jgi:hypothetical protein
MLYLWLALGLGVLGIVSISVGYKLFGYIMCLAAIVSLITWFRNPGISAPEIPDNIPVPGR